jgi:uncharacterized protein YdhG (YjbR/CyaY superfamily)
MDEYISQFPPEVQKILQKIRTSVRKIAPEATEGIVYAIPTFRLKGKNFVHFAAFVRHIGFYPTPSVLTAFASKLKGYKGAKGSVQFPLDQEIPYGLIEEMVKFRLKQMQSA